MSRSDNVLNIFGHSGAMFRGMGASAQSPKNRLAQGEGQHGKYGQQLSRETRWFRVPRAAETAAFAPTKHSVASNCRSRRVDKVEPR